jgi:hypothetical protein
MSLEYLDQQRVKAFFADRLRLIEAGRFLVNLRLLWGSDSGCSHRISPFVSCEYKIPPVSY